MITFAQSSNSSLLAQAIVAWVLIALQVLLVLVFAVYMLINFCRCVCTKDDRFAKPPDQKQLEQDVALEKQLEEKMKHRSIASTTSLEGISPFIHHGLLSSQPLSSSSSSDHPFAVENGLNQSSYSNTNVNVPFTNKNNNGTTSSDTTTYTNPQLTNQSPMYSPSPSTPYETFTEYDPLSKSNRMYPESALIHDNERNLLKEDKDAINTPSLNPNPKLNSEQRTIADYFPNMTPTPQSSPPLSEQQQQQYYQRDHTQYPFQSYRDYHPYPSNPYIEGIEVPLTPPLSNQNQKIKESNKNDKSGFDSTSLPTSNTISASTRVIHYPSFVSTDSSVPVPNKTNRNMV